MKFWQKHHQVTFLRKINRSKEPIRLAIVEEAKKVGGSVLDVGCITCIDYPMHKKAGLKYTGVDVTPKFVKHARKLYPEVDVHEGNILSLPFKNRSFTTVYCKDVLEYLPPGKWRKALKEMWRVARKLVMTAHCEPPWDKPPKYTVLEGKAYYVWENRYNKAEYTTFIKNLSGFSKLEVREPIKSLKNRDLALYMAWKKHG